MEILRVNRDPWGQDVLVGVSWDLLWVFFGAGIAFIVAHMLFMWFGARRKKHGATTSPDAAG